jgi:hypothetical protein
MLVKNAFVVSLSSVAKYASIALADGFVIFPTGVKNAPLYNSGFSRIIGEAAAKVELYAPTSGVVKTKNIKILKR